MRKLFAVAVLASSTMLAASSERKLQQIELCTLVAHWQEFSGKTVRVKAVFQEGAEQSALSDSGCRNRELLVAVLPRSHVEGKKRRLRRILRKHRQAEVVLEGVFRGSELAPIDPKLPEPIKERLKGSTLRYGHLGSFDMMIEVTRIVEADELGKR